MNPVWDSKILIKSPPTPRLTWLRRGKEVIEVKRRDAMLIFVKGIGLISVALFKGCPAFVSPEKPDDPDIEELYSFKVEYHRPQGSIVSPYGSNPTGFGFFMAYRPDGIEYERGQRPLEKIAENVFAGDFDNILCKQELDKIRVVDFLTMDYKRETPAAFYTVGDDFYLINKKTGISYKLTKVIKNPYTNWYEGGTIARCHILHDGSVSSEG